jgi:hypothetical protein
MGRCRDHLGELISAICLARQEDQHKDGVSHQTTLPISDNSLPASDGRNGGCFGLGIVEPTSLLGYATRLTGHGATACSERAVNAASNGAQCRESLTTLLDYFECLDTPHVVSSNSPRVGEQIAMRMT